jgi:hypothetical protein
VPDWFAEARTAFAAKYPDRPPMTWPMNLENVDDLIACFDKPYAETGGCAQRMKGGQ